MPPSPLAEVSEPDGPGAGGVSGSSSVFHSKSDKRSYVKSVDEGKRPRFREEALPFPGGGGVTPVRVGV